MTPKRRSLSASLGSWRVHLAYDPDVPTREAAPASDALAPGVALALLPAFLAAGASVLAALLALSHFLGVAGLLRVLLVLLGVGVTIAYGARCAPPVWGRICGAARWPLALVLVVCAVSLGWSEPFASLLREEPNVQAASFIGFVLLLSVLLIGSRSGGRIVPVAAPLVPGLSLFGLLCLVAVDGITQACFLGWAGAALYLLCYDRFLRRVAPELSSGVPALLLERREVRRGDAPAWALQSVLVSSVWFALFLGGGALLYWPVQAVLPNMATFAWNRDANKDGTRKLDYRGNAPVMELRGGSHALSEKAVMRVTVMQGVPSGLWRGRVYEVYDKSLWSERRQLNGRALRSPRAARRPFRLTQPRELDPLRPTPPQLGPREGTVERVLETVEALNDTPSLVYSSGQPLAWKAVPEEFDYTDPLRASDLSRPLVPYRVRSFVTRPSLRVLGKAPGINPQSLEADPPGKAVPAKGNGKVKGKAEGLVASDLSPAVRENLRLNLVLPDADATRAALQSIASQVRQSGYATQTPDQKIRAIDSYLRRTCLYSLNSPNVPPTQDATLFFLTQSRQGACDMFASSMTLLAREMGVPARVVSGYLDPGDPAMQSESAQGRITYTLRERDAHAWVEYYVPKFGWLTFDPTQSTRQVEPSVAGQLAQMFNVSQLPLPPALLALPILGVALIGAGLIWHRNHPGARTNENERQRIESAYAQAQRALQGHVPRAPSLTPGEYEARVGRAPLSATVKQEFAALTHLYLAARYGPTPTATSAQVEACLARLKKALREK